MRAILVAKAGSNKGKEVKLRPEKPRIMPVNRNGQKSGEIQFHCHDGQWLFRNTSDLDSAVNDFTTTEQALADGDVVSCGAHVFEFRCIDSAPTKDSFEPDPGMTMEIVKDVESEVESSEDVLSEPSEALEPRAAVEEPALSPMEAVEAAEKSHRRHLEETGEQKILEEGSGRSSRKISAARMPVVGSDDKKKKSSGIMRAVGGILPKKKEQQSRLEELQVERDNVLRDAGRHALEEQGGIGLPPGFLNSMARGDSATLTKNDLIVTALERHQRFIKKLQFLDAEIAALCAETGVEAPRIESNDLHLEQELESQEERAFLAMDDLNTQELITELDENFQAEDTVPEHPATVKFSSMEAAAMTEQQDKPTDSASGSSARRRRRRR